MKRVLIVFIFTLSTYLTVFAQGDLYVELAQTVEAFKSSISKGASNLYGSVVAVVSSNKNLKLYTSSLEEKPIPQLSNLIVEEVAISNSGRALVAGTNTGDIYYVDLLLNEVKKFGIHKTIAKTLALQDETILFSSVGDNIVFINDLVTGNQIGTLTKIEEVVEKIAIRPAMKQFAVGLLNGQVKVFLISKLTPLATLTDLNSKITSLTYSPDKKYIAASSYDGNICLWDAETFVMKMKYNHKKSVSSMAFDLENKWLAVSSRDSTITFYDLSNFSRVKTITDADGYATYLTFLNDGCLLSTTTKGSLKKWRVSTGPYDTVNPVIVVEKPSASTPAKVIGNSYEIIGYVYDDNEIYNVTLNGNEVKLEPASQNELSKVPVGIKSVKRFNVRMNLDSIGINPFEIKAKDKANHEVIINGVVQRLSPDQAVEVITPIDDSNVNAISIPIKFIPWFDIDSYSISVNLVDIVSDQKVEFKSAGDLIVDEIPLVAGFNQIRLSVKGTKGERFLKNIVVNRSASAVAGTGSFDKTKKERVAGSGPQRWAVVVGISEYSNPNIPKLSYADKDAEAFANFLRRPEGGGYDSDHMRVLLNKDATLQNLRDALINFLNQAIDIDLVVIYFAGHGMPDPARPANMYLLTYDSDPTSLGTTAFPMWDIQTVLARYINAKRVVVFSDACHSGGISVNFATRGLGTAEDNLVNQYLTDLSKTKEGIVVFTASAAGEVSQEYPELGHGVFTYYLLQGLEGKADYNNDYTVTINELMQYVEEQVKRKTRGAQNPTRSQTQYDKELTIAIIPH